MKATPVGQICDRLDQFKLSHSFIYSIDDIMNDAHYEARGRIEAVDNPRTGPVRMARTFPKFSGGPNKPIQAAPTLDHHNDEIYSSWLGLDAAQRAALARDGII